MWRRVCKEQREVRLLSNNGQCNGDMYSASNREKDGSIIDMMNSKIRLKSLKSSQLRESKRMQ